ncbi:lipopolysaccharide biosynthesis protein [Anaerobaca lacustris]|uniref:Oligosaccharide flippase family protein n=1 Tax=Anaerobaca lacustris TaxID=3044600 RepID=A0AAW6TR57_9BACT|nr:oligosaccharide flippase family protein [Sedimentisphaerales bacterium M17dextr]
METIINLWTDNRRRVWSWFQDDVFRRLFINAGKLLSANVVGAVLGLIAAVLTARALGPQNYGVLALVLVYELTVGKLVTFNAWQAVIKFGSEALHTDDRASLRQLVKFGFTLDVASAIVGTVLAVVLAGPVIRLLGWDASVRPLLVLYSLLILFSLSGTPIGILRLFDRFDLLSYTAILSGVVRLAGVAWCLVTRQALFGFVLVYLVTGIIGQLYQVFASLWVLHAQRIMNIVQEPLRGVRSRFPGIVDYVWTTNLNSTIRMLSREADELIIAALTTPAALGIFKVAKQFAQVLPRFLDPLYQSIYPELSRLWAADRRRAFVSLIKRATLIVGSVAMLGWLVFILLGQRLIVWTVGPAYSQAYLVAAIYLLALVIALCAFALHPAMLAVGMPRKSFKAQVAATILYLVLLFPAVRTLDISGASLAYVVYYVLWSVLMLYYLRPSLGREPCHI